jgi:hypothetical protein
MESTVEEAVTLLNKWKAKSSELQVMLAAEGITVGFPVTVGEVSDTSVQLLGSNGAEAVLWFAEASFEWGAQCGMPIPTRFKSILTVSLPHCDFMLAEPELQSGA